jgi:hypothetical protein
MLKRLKNIILIDETLPKENLKKIISKRAKYLFFGGWVFSSMLLLVLSLEVVDYNTTKPFVDFMGSVVPSIKNLDNYILHGKTEVPYFMSFYYSILWLLTVSVLPICLVYNKQRVFFIFGLANLKSVFEKRKLLHSLGFIILTMALISVYSHDISNYALNRYANFTWVAIFGGIIIPIGVIYPVLMWQEIVLVIFKSNKEM